VHNRLANHVEKAHAQMTDQSHWRTTMAEAEEALLKTAAAKHASNCRSEQCTLPARRVDAFRQGHANTRTSRNSGCIALIPGRCGIGQKTIAIKHQPLRPPQKSAIRHALTCLRPCREKTTSAEPSPKLAATCLLSDQSSSCCLCTTHLALGAAHAEEGLVGGP